MIIGLIIICLLTVFLIIYNLLEKPNKPDIEYREPVNKRQNSPEKTFVGVTADGDAVYVDCDNKIHIHNDGSDIKIAMTAMPEKKENFGGLFLNPLAFTVPEESHAVNIETLPFNEKNKIYRQYGNTIVSHNFSSNNDFNVVIAKLEPMRHSLHGLCESSVEDAYMPSVNGITVRAHGFNTNGNNITDPCGNIIDSGQFERNLKILVKNQIKGKFNMFPAFSQIVHTIKTPSYGDTPLKNGYIDNKGYIYFNLKLDDLEKQDLMGNEFYLTWYTAR